MPLRSPVRHSKRLTGLGWVAGRVSRLGRRARKYWTRVELSGREYNAGYYDTLEEAEAAVIAKRRELYTHDDYAEWAASA